MYLAHISKDGREQPLSEHLEVVARLCGRFAAKARMPGTGRLLGLAHDAGKTNPDYLPYLRYSHANPGDHSLRGRVVHSTQGAKLLVERYGGGDAASRLTAALTALAAACHHGGLMDCQAPDGTAPFFARLAGGDPALHCEEVLAALPSILPGWGGRDALFATARGEVLAFGARCQRQGLRGGFPQHLLARFLFSCLVDADRADAWRFEAGLPPERLDDATPPWAMLADRLEEHLAGLDAAGPVGRQRADISRRCREAAARPRGVYQLCVPTGGGKTLSSLRFALEHARLQGMDHVFYIIPFTTIIDQNARDIRDALLPRGPEREEPPWRDLILEHHSNVVPERQPNGPGGADGPDDDGAAKLLTERWTSPIVLTTMVQFLNALFAGGAGAARRMHPLSNSVLIFDEIQAAPLRCTHLLTSALNFLSRLCGCTVVLCTATQPDLAGVARPLGLSDQPQLVDGLDDVFRAFRRTCVRTALLPGDGYRPDRLASFVLEKLTGLRTGLVILNTKATASACWQELRARNDALPPEERYELFYLSTDLCPAHRRVLLERMEGLLPQGRVLCVSTQLIEAGVNLSFQCVVRALAGLDSIAQAAGRCNRHGEAPCRDVWVVNPAGETLTHLPEIAKGQDAARRVLDDMERYPGRYGDDLLSPAAIAWYFQNYNTLVEGQMDYPLGRAVPEAPKATLYDLLDKNRVSPGEGTPLRQAFGTAGRLFQAIGRQTTAVLVPYRDEGDEKTGRRPVDGAALIAALRVPNLPLEEHRRLLRAAQRVAVSVYDNVYRQLEREGALEALPGGAVALAGRFYDKELGVTTKGGPLGFLNA